MSEFICGGEKYELGGTKSRTIGMIVHPEGLPPSIEVEAYTLQLKTAFHVSLVFMDEIVRKYGVTDPEFKDKVIADFCEFVAANPVELVRYRNEYRFMSADERRSVIVMCDVSNLDKFFDLLNKKYSLSVEYPPTHVTLYTLQLNVGIFMTDSDELEKLSKIIPAPVKL